MGSWSVISAAVWRLSHPWMPPCRAGLTCVSDWIASDEGSSRRPVNRRKVAGRPRLRRSARAGSGRPHAGGFHSASFSGSSRMRRSEPLRRRLLSLAFISLRPRWGRARRKPRCSRPINWYVGFNRGFYFALPTKLTSDRIHQRVEAFLQGCLRR